VNDLLVEQGEMPTGEGHAEAESAWRSLRYQILAVASLAIRAVIDSISPQPIPHPYLSPGWRQADPALRLAMMREYIGQSNVENPYFHWVAELEAASHRWVSRPIGIRGSFRFDDEGNMLDLIAFLSEFRSPSDREARSKQATSAWSIGIDPNGCLLAEIRAGIREFMDADLERFEGLSDVDSPPADDDR
jgi:hypothetical protein